MPTLVHADWQGPVARITLDSPQNRNALSEELLQQLTREVTRARDEAQIRVLVLAHEGKAFCSGADLRQQTSALAQGARPEGVGGLVPLLRLLQDCPKPIVAAVGGPARAGGVGLVAACDIAVASEAASFATGEVRIGLAPAVLSVVALPRLGPTAAADLFLTGRVVGAQEALRMGLVARAVPEDQLAAEVQEVVSALLLAHPNALAACKRILARVPRLEREAAFTEMAQLSRSLFGTAEAEEGMSAFLERRPPNWVA
ncbi:MAG: enoyl-CoA hydratase-related protein [Candidatus Dormibacteria bacterium]